MDICQDVLYARVQTILICNIFSVEGYIIQLIARCARAEHDSREFVPTCETELADKAKCNLGTELGKLG